MDPQKLALLEAKALQDIQDLKTEANELKFQTYPETRPFGWEPLREIEPESEYEGEHYAFDGSQPQQSSRLDEHLHLAEGGGNPPLEALFGKGMAERLMLRSDLLGQRKRGRPRKGDKSASGSLGGGNVLSQQVNGISLKKQPNGPSTLALKGVQQRTGGLVNFASLVQNQAIPGRVLVGGFLIYNFFDQTIQTPQHSESLKKAAEFAMHLETQKGAPPLIPEERSSMNESNAISASTLVENAYKQLYQRIQDSPDRDLSWRNDLLDKLDSVSENSKINT